MVTAGMEAIASPKDNYLIFSRPQPNKRPACAKMGCGTEFLAIGRLRLVSNRNASDSVGVRLDVGQVVNLRRVVNPPLGFWPLTSKNHFCGFMLPVLVDAPCVASKHHRPF